VVDTHGVRAARRRDSSVVESSPAVREKLDERERERDANRSTLRDGGSIMERARRDVVPSASWRSWRLRISKKREERGTSRKRKVGWRTKG